MTVCIAAVCESGKKIAVAADRMLTYPPPINLEFQTKEKKIEDLAPSCVALAAGMTGNSIEILQNIRRKFGGNQSLDISELLNYAREEYARSRMNKFFQTTVIPMLGLDFEKFVSNGGTMPAYLQVQPQVYQQLVMQSVQFNLGVDLIIAGIDETRPHIALIINPGTLISLEKLGYGAIGSGGIHATIHLSLSAQTSRKSLFETLYNIYVGKKASEAAPGVGEETDVAVVEKERVRHCTKPVMEKLNKMFDESSKKRRVDYAGLEKIFNEEHK